MWKGIVEKECRKERTNITSKQQPCTVFETGFNWSCFILDDAQNLVRPSYEKSHVFLWYHTTWKNCQQVAFILFFGDLFAFITVFAAVGNTKKLFYRLNISLFLLLLFKSYLLLYFLFYFYCYFNLSRIASLLLCFHPFSNSHFASFLIYSLPLCLLWNSFQHI